MKMILVLLAQLCVAKDGAFEADAEAQGYFQELADKFAPGVTDKSKKQDLVRCAQNSTQKETDDKFACLNKDNKCVQGAACAKAEQKIEISKAAEIIGRKLKGDCKKPCSKCKRADLDLKPNLDYKGKVSPGVCNGELLCVDSDQLGSTCLDTKELVQFLENSKTRRLSPFDAQSGALSVQGLRQQLANSSRLQQNIAGVNVQNVSVRQSKVSRSIEVQLRQSYRQSGQLWFPEAKNIALVRGITVEKVCEARYFFGCNPTALPPAVQTVYSSCVACNMEALYVKPSFTGFGCPPIDIYLPGSSDLDRLLALLKELLQSQIDGYLFDSEFYPYQAIFNLNQFPELIHGDVKQEGIEIGVTYHQFLNNALYDFYSSLNGYSSWDELTLGFSKKRQFVAKMNIGFFQTLFGRIQSLNLSLSVTQIVHILGDWCKLEPHIHSGSIGSFYQQPGRIVQKKTTTLYHRYEIEYRKKLVASISPYCADVYPQATYVLNYGGAHGLVGRPIRLADGAKGHYDDLEARLYNGIVIPNAHKVGRVALQPGCNFITPGRDQYNKVNYYYSYTREVEIDASPCFHYYSKSQVTVVGTKYELAPKPFSCECHPIYTVCVEAIKKRYTTAVTTYTNYKIAPPQYCIIWTLATVINVGIKVTQESFSKTLMVKSANSFGQHKVELTKIEKSSLQVETIGLTVGVSSIYVYSPCFRKVKIISPRATSCVSYCKLVQNGGYKIGGSSQLSLRYSLQAQTDGQAVKYDNFNASYLGAGDEEGVEETAEEEVVDEENKGDESGTAAASFFLAFALLI